MDCITQNIFHPQFGSIRIVVENTNILYFASKDVAKILGFSKAYKAVRDFVNDKDKKMLKIKTPGGSQQTSFVNQDGLHSLIKKSKNDVREFKAWVNSEIIEKYNGTQMLEEEDDDVVETSNNSTSSEVMIFENPMFGDVRVVLDEHDEPRFCLKDVCDVLELQSSAVVRRLSNDVICSHPIVDSLGRTQVAVFIDEDGLYDVILDSRKPEAKRFRKWITSDVLPSIRKHGAYMTDNTINRALEDPDFLIQLATNLKNEKIKRLAAEDEVRQKQLQIEEMKDKVSYLDIIMSSDSSVHITQIAQDYGLSAIKMNELLRDLKVQYRCGDQWILYADYKDKGYVRSETLEIKKNDGQSIYKLNTKWTQKGRRFIYNVLKKANIVPVVEKQNSLTLFD